MSYRTYKNYQNLVNKKLFFKICEMLSDFNNSTDNEIEITIDKLQETLGISKNKIHLNCYMWTFEMIADMFDYVKESMYNFDATPIVFLGATFNKKHHYYEPK